VSTYFDKPDWQAQAVVPEKTLYDFIGWSFTNPESFTGRGCPDVAAHADFLSGYKIIVEGKERYGGGTSAATPLIAALITRLCEGVGQRLGFLNPLLYELQLGQGVNVCQPITRGNNGGYAASPEHRWNPCTGLGSLRGKTLLRALRKIYSP